MRQIEIGKAPARTRQLLCRSIFLLLCLVPLMGTVTWAAWRHFTLDAEAYRQWIGGQLGLDVRISAVVQAAPGTTRLEDLNVLDPESGKLVARCKSIVVRRGDRVRGIHLSSTHVQPGQFGRLLELLHNRLLRQKSLLQTPLLVVCDHVSVPGSGRELDLGEFRLDALDTSQGPEALITFRWAERPASELVRLHLLRTKAPSPQTKIELLTGDTPLPCTLFLTWPEPFAALGDDVTFTGNLRMESTPLGWSGDITGHVANLTLERLARAQSSSGISGPVALTLRRAVFQHNWVQILEGSLTAGPGNVDRALLQAAHHQLEMPLHLLPGRTSGTEPIPYAELKVEFELSGEGVVMQGNCGELASGDIIAGSAGPLLSQPLHQPLPSIALVRTLFGMSIDQVPITPDDEPLLRAIPFK